MSSFGVQEITIGEIQEGLASSQITARSLVAEYLERIEFIDWNYFGLRSVIETNPDVFTIAHELDREYRQKGPRGVLHGVPILVKDNIDTGDRMLTTAGSLALADSPAPKDAFLVERLRAAGAIILGKSNLSEWANFRSTHSISGWSARGGQCCNPYVLNRNPGGSSSGSGVAVASSLCVVSVGTETDGSITSPAAVNGIVGLKPTVGLISRSGVIPIAHSQDTAGPMGRTVRDVAILLTVLAGVDSNDPATKKDILHSMDFTKFLDPEGLSGARLGVARKFFGSNAEVDRLINQSISIMQGCGAEIVDPADLPSHGQYDDSEAEVLSYEFKSDLNEYLKVRGDSIGVHSLAEIISFNKKWKDEEMPYFEQERMIEAQKKGPLTEQAYLDALAKSHRLSRDKGIDAVVKKHHVDAIVAPTRGPAFLTDLVNGDPKSTSCARPAAVAGYPHITVPAGYVRGLPIGISFFGPAWSEPTLLKIAYAYEQATMIRCSPRFLPVIF
jgi:amidase